MKRIALIGLLLCVGFLISKVFAHPALNSFILVAAHTTSDTFSYAHSGRLVTNPAATGTLTFDLPPAAPGLHFIFAVAAAQAIVVVPDSGDQIIVLTNMSDEEITSDTTIGTTVELVAIDDSKWLPIRRTGAWQDL
jgi:hypothetical protein